MIFLYDAMLSASQIPYSDQRPVDSRT